METIELELTQAPTQPNIAFHVSPAALIRVGGLPLAATDGLAHESLGVALERSCMLQSARASIAAELSELLHRSIGDQKGNAELQRALINIRRNVFNGRRPAEADLKLALPHAEGEVQTALAQWLQLGTELEEHNRASELLLQTVTQRGRQHLRTVVSNPDFRKGLLLSSPSFERTLIDYARQSGPKLDKKLRRTERTLLSYLFRTTHKTSPFSTLTPVSMVHFSSNLADRQSPVFELREIACAVKPNLGILSRVWQALTDNAIHYQHLRLSVKEGAAIDGTRIKYWKRTETPVSHGGPIHTRISEHTFLLHVTATLKIILAAMDEQGTMSVREIQETLSNQLNLQPAEISEYIRILVENGLLVVAGVRQSVFDGACWPKFAAALRDMRDSTLTEIAEGIDKIPAYCRQFEVAPVSDRPAILNTLETEVKQILAAARSTAPVPHPLLYEDSRVSSQPIQVNQAAWSNAFSDLADLQRVLSLFDPLLISKVSLKALFKKRFRAGGTCRNLLEFSDYFQDVFYRPYQQAKSESGRKDKNNPFSGVINPLRLPEITELLGARAQVAAAISDAMSAWNAAGCDADEITLNANMVHSIGAYMLGCHRTLSNSLFFQAAVEDGELQLVLNHVYGGFGCMYTRFSHLFAESGSESLERLLRSNIVGLSQPDTVLAEFQGGHETNLNQHNLLTDAEILCPGELGTATPKMQIPILELHLKHDPNTDQLYLFSERLGRRITPLYLGMMYPLVLPELQTLLLHFSPPTIIRSELLPKQLPSGNLMSRQPRLRYRSVVIERASWTVPIDGVPARGNQEPDYQYLLRLTNWRKATGLPQELFAKLIPAGLTLDDDGAAASGAQKPFYLNFENPFCVSLFEKLLTDNKGFIQFSEMLPTGKNAILTHQNESYVSEFVVELTQRA